MADAAPPAESLIIKAPVTPPRALERFRPCSRLFALGQENRRHFRQSLGVIAAPFGSGLHSCVGDRGLSRACVVGKNKALWELGQYHCLKFCCQPGMGIATKFGARSAP